MLQEIVTFFSSHKSETVKPVSLGQVLSAFKNGRFSERITSARKVLDERGEDEYKKAKGGLPAIAFCGEFAGGHAKENLVEHNNLLVFDIDHLSQNEMEKARAMLAADSLILSFWTSPSGSGYKGLIRLDYQNVPDGVDLDSIYKKAFEDATVLFRERFGIELDKNCSDYSRICYVCWDENLYVNERAEKLVVDCSEVSLENKKSPQKQGARPKAALRAFKPVYVAGKNSQHARNMVSSIIKYLSKRGLSITYSYDEWLRVGFAIASTFNYDLGVKYFLALSQLDKGKYNEDACVEKLQECYMSGTGEITLGTIVKMARNKGYKGSSEDI